MFQNMGKERVNKVQEEQRVPERINSRRNTQKHIVIKWTKIKDRDKILKTTREKQQITYKGTPIRLSADFSTETLQARMERHDVVKVMNGNNIQPRIFYPKDTSSDFMEIKKAFQTRQAKVNRIQHHQTSFKTNAKGTSLGRKHKRRKRPTEKKSKTIKKMVIESYISIITLNVNGLNAPTKRPRLAGWMNTCAYMHFHLPHHSAYHPNFR